jgi:hypothetical protein
MNPFGRLLLPGRAPIPEPAPIIADALPCRNAAFAAARRTEEAKDLPRAHTKAEPVHDGNLAEAVRQIHDFDAKGPPAVFSGTPVIT